jgi:hypothetical protein
MERSKVEFVRIVDYTGKIKVDVEQLKRVIFNLSNNAISAMKDGGVFGLECRLVANEVEFRIRDSGPGIPAEIRSKLFNAFATFGKKEGTGLELVFRGPEGRSPTSHGQCVSVVVRSVARTNGGVRSGGLPVSAPIRNARGATIGVV